MNYQKKILNKKQTGEKIRLLIVQSTITYENLADMLDLTSPRVIYDWVNGFKLPNLENLFNLSLIFNEKIENIISLV